MGLDAAAKPTRRSVDGVFKTTAVILWIGAALARKLRVVERSLRLERGRTVVEGHHDVGADGVLHRNRSLGREQELGTVDERAELNAVLADLGAHIAARFTSSAHRPCLETARVGEDRLGPAHELVAAAEVGDALGSGAKHQVVSVVQNDLRAGRLDLIGRETLHGCGGCHRHERGRVETAVRRGDAAAASLGRARAGKNLK